MQPEKKRLYGRAEKSRSRIKHNLTGLFHIEIYEVL